MTGAIAIVVLSFTVSLFTLAAYIKWRSWNMLAMCFSAISIMAFYGGIIIDGMHGNQNRALFIVFSRYAWSIVLFVYLGNAIAELITRKVNV